MFSFAQILIDEWILDLSWIEKSQYQNIMAVEYILRVTIILQSPAPPKYEPASVGGHHAGHLYARAGPQEHVEDLAIFSAHLHYVVTYLDYHAWVGLQPVDIGTAATVWASTIWNVGQRIAEPFGPDWTKDIHSA